MKPDLKMQIIFEQHSKNILELHLPNIGADCFAKEVVNKILTFEDKKKLPPLKGDGNLNLCLTILFRYIFLLLNNQFC